jgi:hypothetical protein
MKYKNMAQVKRLAAAELRKSGGSPELIEELEAMAKEIEESHLQFVEMAESMEAMKAFEKSINESQN